ncbi:hypothetical protein BH23CHL8_BH23CHL8_08950 [soil metagenome]
MRSFRGRKRVAVHDPIVEPLWSGLRVFAHVSSEPGGSGAVVRLAVEGRADLALELPALAAELGRSVDCAEAIIDGIITRQVSLQGIGVAAIPEVRASQSQLLLGNSADLDIRRREPAKGDRGDPGDPEREPQEGFVAVDLLRLDGTDLLDVPLLERKRLLESVVSQTELVRVSLHTRPPFENWVATWKALGLRGAILKAANSRYRPGARSLEWRVVESVGGRGH